MAEGIVTQAFVSTLGLIGIKTPRAKKSGDSLVELPAHAVPYGAVDRLSKTLDIDPGALISIIGLSERTAARRKKEKYLKPEEADRLLRVARLTEEAARIFGSVDKAALWLKTTHPMFGEHTPLSMLSSDAGARAVGDELGRIDYGDFA